MSVIKVWPSRKGLIVYDMAGRVIPEEGKSLIKSVYIVRQIKSGDLVTEDPRKAGKKKKEGDK